MGERDHFLHGAEDVRTGASIMRSAADTMSSAASSMQDAANRIRDALYENQLFMSQWLDRFEAAGKPALDLRCEACKSED